MADEINSKQQKTWCPLPWKSINVRNNGDFRVCCSANFDLHTGMIRSPSGAILNAKDASLNAVRNSSLLCEVRQAMLRGERHETCRHCHLEEDSGLRSRRNYENEFWRDDFSFQDALTSTDSEGRINSKDLPVGYMDIRFGNLCNLKCLMCGPESSTFWYSDHLATLGPSFSDTTGPVTLERAGNRVRISGANPYAWYESEVFWQEIRDHLGHIKKIYCVGGEPLLIEQHQRMLRMLIEHGQAEQIILEYNSNLTVLPRAVLDLWSNFKEVRFMASLDGCGPVNDYIRHPSRWSVLERNLDFLDQMDGRIKLSIFATLQIFNIYHLTDFLQWKINKDFKRLGATSPMSPFIKTQPLYTPPYLSMRALPIEAKQMVTDKFDHFYNAWFLDNVGRIPARFGDTQTLCRRMHDLLEGYKNWMWAEDLSHELPNFITASEKLDRLRQTNWKQIIPEFVEPILRIVNQTNQGMASNNP
jgi:MoaA/NifB/PqqE/SkfB family radical SAM enzyme